jgi:hypothetical protein
MCDYDLTDIPNFVPVMLDEDASAEADDMIEYFKPFAPNYKWD